MRWLVKPEDKRVLRVKWVFAYNWKSDGTLNTGSPVVIGCIQRYGEDFLDSFD